jgi:uncharacterized short protein YbdD (DUF466 family)
MDTSDDKKIVAVPADMPMALTTGQIDADLDAAMGVLPETKAVVPLVSVFTPETLNKGKKNARFGRNPDGTPAKKADKKEIERKSDWGKFLHDFKQKHPDIYGLEATIEARKVYVPKSGKQKSFERIFTEVWKQTNPGWPRMTKEERTAAIRKAFIAAI